MVSSVMQQAHVAQQKTASSVESHSVVGVMRKRWLPSSRSRLLRGFRRRSVAEECAARVVGRRVHSITSGGGRHGIEGRQCPLELAIAVEQPMPSRRVLDMWQVSSCSTDRSQRMTSIST